MAQRRGVGLRDGTGAGTIHDGGASSVEGGASRLLARDSIAARFPAEVTHVVGALAADPVRLSGTLPPTDLRFAAEWPRPYALVLPLLPETLAGSVAGAVIQMVEPGESTVVLDSLGAAITAAPSPRGFLDPLWRTARAADSAAMVAVQAGPYDWYDPASVAGAGVTMIGAATLVVSNWPAAI